MKLIFSCATLLAVSLVVSSGASFAQTETAPATFGEVKELLLYSGPGLRNGTTPSLCFKESLGLSLRTSFAHRFFTSRLPNRLERP